MEKGKLIVLMGIDGAGKTTLLNNLNKCSDALHLSNWRFKSVFENPIFTKELETVANENGKTRRECFSSNLRSIIWRNDLINNTLLYILPELEKGNTVILDRYTLCNRVYSKLDDSNLQHMDKMLEILPKPDLGIFLDVDIDIAIKRINERGNERAPYEDKKGLKELRQRYLQLMPLEKYSIVTINANQPERLVVEDVFYKIIQLYQKHTKEKEK